MRKPLVGIISWDLRCTMEECPRCSRSGNRKKERIYMRKNDRTENYVCPRCTPSIKGEKRRQREAKRKAA